VACSRDNSEQWGRVWQRMDSKFFLRAQQAQQSVWKTIVAVKKKPQKETLKEKMHKQEMEILREAPE